MTDANQKHFFLIFPIFADLVTREKTLIYGKDNLAWSKDVMSF